MSLALASAAVRLCILLLLNISTAHCPFLLCSYFQPHADGSLILPHMAQIEKKEGKSLLLHPLYEKIFIYAKFQILNTGNKFNHQKDIKRFLSLFQSIKNTSIQSWRAWATAGYSLKMTPVIKHFTRYQAQNLKLLYIHFLLILTRVSRTLLLYIV